MLLQEETKKTKRDKYIKACDCCHRLYDDDHEGGWIEFQPKTRHTIAYMCPECAKIKSYNDDNDVIRYSDYGEYNAYTFSFELESVPYNKECNALLCSSDYKFLPTFDASLPLHGVEYKSLIYPNLHGVKNILRTYMECADTSSPKCGSHINIGHVTYINHYNMDILRVFASVLFNPLAQYLKEHETETINIFGRYFTGYADILPIYDTHASWINLSHDERIEFRLAKCVNATQYFYLINMCKDIVECIIKKFLNKEHSSRQAERTSYQLIEIFIKYANGEANCQRPERNSK